MSRPPRVRPAGVAAIAAGALAVAHAGPAVNSWRGLRLAMAPTLSGIGRSGQVALTFDDGPDPKSTPQFLKFLADRNIRATFFLLGFMVDRAPGLAAEIVAAGHEIGLHGYAHRNLLFRGPLATHDDIVRGAETVAAASGRMPRFYRPPYGALTTAALVTARRLDLQPVLWSSWGWDWGARSTPASVQQLVTRQLDDRGTILLHDSDCTSAPDSWRTTLAALPGVVDHCRDHDLNLVPLSQHLGGTHRTPVSERTGRQ